MNQTIMDGSVIIHRDSNPTIEDPSFNSMNFGDFEKDENSERNRRASDYELNEHNEGNDTSINTQLNISCFDNTMNTSQVEPQNTNIPDAESKPLIERGGFAMLRRKLKENAAKENKEKIQK